MDSFFDVLIIFVIIISILNAVFGKKKKQEHENPENLSEPVARNKKQDSVDLLEQLFGVPSQTKKPEYKTTKTGYGQTWNPEEEFGEITSVHQPVKRVDVNYDKLKSLEISKPKPTKKVEKIEIVSSNIVKQNKRQKEIIRNLKNPKTIREYILVSEILGKPIALKD